MNTIDQNKSNKDTNTQNRPRTLGLQDAILLTTLIVIAAFVRFGNITEEESSAFTELTSTSEVVTNTETLIGKTVTIRSNPVQKVSSSSFTINDQSRMFQDPILVVNASGVPFDLPTNLNRKVEVRGQVRNFVIPEIERDFNLNLQDEYYTAFSNRPTIIAQSIKLLD